MKRRRLAGKRLDLEGQGKFQLWLDASAGAAHQGIVSIS
jgi:hypothetical protein